MSYDIEQRPASKNAWFTPAESNNYYAARYSREGITSHWWGDGTGADNHDNIVNYFLAQSAAGIKSVNFVVSDKKITQMVADENVAWASNAGNPTTISIEFQPTLSDEGYKRGGWLIATLEKKYGHKMNLHKHSDWVATSCPGTIDNARLRREADAATSGTIPAPAPAPAPAPTPAPTTAQTVYLPASVATWAAYRPYSSYVKGSADQVGTLRPSLFGGLTYEIIGRDNNVVFIQTKDFGKVAIWVQNTEAVIRGAQNYVPAAPVQGTPAPSGQTVTFPASVANWAVYRVGSGYRKGTSDQVGTILPATFGGLTYPVVQNLGNVVVIDTQNFGRVAAWVQNTEAIIR